MDVDAFSTPTDGCLNGKTCLVLGGGSLAAAGAIGQAIALAYARAGASVAVADIDIDAARATVAMIDAQGLSGSAHAVDCGSPESVTALVEDVEKKFGPVSVLHNNVGIGKAGDSANTSADDFRRICDTNLLSLHLASQAVIPGMRRAGGGVILCTSSITSLRHIGVPHLAYGVTKAAVNHFCALLAAEYAEYGIRANAIVVGTVDTPRIRQTMLKAYGGDEAAMIAARNAQIPLGFMGNAWDVANAAVFLASDRARFISGQSLVLDGALCTTVRS